MNLAEYTTYDATGLAELVKQGDVSAYELAELAQQAIEKVNPDVGAVVGDMWPWQQELDSSVDKPLAGVPFLIKDISATVAGKPCEMGSRLMQGYTPKEDSYLVRRYREAGLTLMGRSNSPDFGFNANTAPLLHGPTRNPWDVRKSAGGSSGGAAAAVASGMVPIAHASDAGGSIRIPAGCCGLVGLKPTRGRMPTGPSSGERLHGMAIEHVVTRSVRDCALVLDLTCGSALGDKYAIKEPRVPYMQVVKAPEATLRIAYNARAWSDVTVDPEVAHATAETAALCEALGHEVSEASPTFDTAAFHAANLTLWTSALHYNIHSAAKLVGRTPSSDNLEASIWACFEHGSTLTAFDLEDAFSVMNRVTRDVARFFTDYDVMLTPSLSCPPPDITFLDANAPVASARHWYDHIFTVCPHTALGNVTGQPGISLPLAWSQEGLPLGMHFLGRSGEEDVLLALAAQLEHAHPWNTKRPAVHAAR